MKFPTTPLLFHSYEQATPWWRPRPAWQPAPPSHLGGGFLRFSCNGSPKRDVVMGIRYGENYPVTGIWLLRNNIKQLWNFMERLKNCEKADSMLQILLHNQIPITGHFFLERFPVTTCNESQNAEAKESSSSVAVRINKLVFDDKAKVKLAFIHHQQFQFVEIVIKKRTPLLLIQCVCVLWLA